MNQQHGQQPREQQQPLTVTELVSRLRGVLQADFSDVWVTGETSDVSRPQSGHIYFTLKDSGAVLRAAAFRNVAVRLKFPVTDGMRVVCRGQLDVYPPRGDCQLIVRHMEPLGAGALQQALEKLRLRLSSEGLFDPRHKQPIPVFPQFVVVITSPTGAAIHDFLEVAGRRWQGARIAILPTRVQNAATEIAKALHVANSIQPTPDVIVLTRGGGSMEDLWCFNEEEVVRAIFTSRIPVVSAIGHEIDVTLSDLVADVRALTPSEAAERVFPSKEEWSQRLQHYSRHLRGLAEGLVAILGSRLQSLSSRPALARPWDRLADLARRLDDHELRMHAAVQRSVRDVNETLAQAAARLESLSPLAVLARGYSVTSVLDSMQVVRDAQQLQVGKRLQHRFAFGSAVSIVEDVQPAAAFVDVSKPDRKIGNSKTQ